MLFVAAPAEVVEQNLQLELAQELEPRVMEVVLERVEGVVEFEQPELLTECHFRIPEVTQLGARFGFTPLSLEEFLTAVTPGASAS